MHDQISRSGVLIGRSAERCRVERGCKRSKNGFGAQGGGMRGPWVNTAMAPSNHSVEARRSRLGIQLEACEVREEKFLVHPCNRNI